MPILTAAAFDSDLVHAVADVISTELRAYANAGRAGLDVWTPNVNPFRDPRWGRGSEVAGEDPFLVSSYAGAFVEGLQGNDPTRPKAIATCKHFAAYDLEDWHNVSRFNFDAIVGTQDLAEYYMPSFEACARDAKAGSIMTTCTC
jgi:beta-D-xylosidase 4